MSQLRSIASIGVSSGRSVLLIWEEFAAQGQLDAVAFRVGLALDRHVEIDRTHDAVAEFLLEQLLPRRAIDLHELVKALDQRIGRHYRRRAAMGELLQQPLFVLAKLEQRRRAFGLLRAQLHLADQ